MRGIEVGALHNPRLPPDHPNVFFLDHASAEGLREKYAADAIMAAHMDQIVEVDYVWSPGQTLSDVVGTMRRLTFYWRRMSWNIYPTQSAGFSRLPTY
ncbi:MAG: hypothetical protein ACT4PW_04780 [Acidimicrobiia bacterium]